MDSVADGGSQPKLLTLSEAYTYHGAALRASLRAEYGVRDIRAESLSDLADMVGWLPPGAALWRAFGGPLAISLEVRELRRVGYWLRVLDYRERGSKGEKPKPDPEPELAGKARVEESHAERQAAAYRRRQGRR